jgi:hypothetical protein
MHEQYGLTLVILANQAPYVLLVSFCSIFATLFASSLVKGAFTRFCGLYTASIAIRSTDAEA